MTTELTQAQRDKRLKQAHTAIANALAASWTEWRRTARRPDFPKAADYAVDGLGDLAAEILADGTMIKALTVKDGVVSLELEPAYEILQIFVASMRAVLDSGNAQNYAEIPCDVPPSVSLDLRDGHNPTDAYTLTLQRRSGLTPHQLREKAEARLAAVLAECDALETQVYGQHDEDDDGIREAVQRIRARAQDTSDG